MERTPEEWRDRLLAELAARRETHALLRAYYTGDHYLPTAPSTVTDTYRRLAMLGVTNMCGLVVDTVNERLRPQGVRLSTDATADTDVWRRIWQANRLDAFWSVAQEEALKIGRCPVLIWPDPDAPKRATVTVEDADEVIVAYAPGSRRSRVAALKTFVDDDVQRVLVWSAVRNRNGATTEEVRAWWRPAGPSLDVYYSSGLRPGMFVQPSGLILPVSSASWEIDAEYSGPNPVGRIPVVELLSKPNVRGEPMPELSPSVIALQNRINKTMFDAVVASEFGAFPQRYAIGIQVERAEDGTALNPLTVGPNRAWVLQKSGDAQATVGQLEPFPLSGLLELADASIKHLASTSQTPVYYLLSGLTNVGADSIRAAETGHVAKIINHQTMFDDPAEETFRLALIIEGEDPPADIEMVWAKPETRSPAEIADAAIKLSTAGWPFLAIARMVGESPTEIERMVLERQAEDVRRAQTEPVALPAA